MTDSMINAGRRRPPRRPDSLVPGKTHILWDHDGVLVDTEPWYFEATRHCLGSLDVELTREQYLADMPSGRSAWELARSRGVPEALIAAQRRQRDALYQRFLQTQDIEVAGVGEVLQGLAERYAMAIVTTSKRTDFELIHAPAQGRDIVRHMRFVLVRDDYEHAKPAPDPYLAALARFDVPASRAVVVEDSERGLRAAVAAGIDTVVVANDFIRHQDLSAATARIGALSELPALLATWS